jgi:hypothetical protein
MANNAFKAVNTVITSVNEIIYTTPPNLTTIVINAQLVNTGIDDVVCTFSYFNSLTGKEINLIRDFRIRGNQSQSATVGRLVVNENDSIKVRAVGSTPESTVRLSLSLLETEDV